jgi:hypothetical protein
MPDTPAGTPGPVNTDGGNYVGRDVVPGRDFIGRDNVTNNYTLDVEKLIGTLRQNLPANDPAPQHLLETLQQFQIFHQQLYEWKELHNCLNDVVFTVDQFAREVERIDATGRLDDARLLARQWRPVAGKIDILIDLAGTVRHIATEPFARQADGGMRGPAWAVELQAARLRVDELLIASAVNPIQLYESTTAFVDTAERHMYLADKQLRDSAAKLYDLSEVVLGQLGHG